MPPDRAAVWFDGQPVSHRHAQSAATRLGIATVYQDLALCDNLDVVANLFLGREVRSPLGVVDPRARRDEDGAALARAPAATCR